VLAKVRVRGAGQHQSHARGLRRLNRLAGPFAGGEAAEVKQVVVWLLAKRELRHVETVGDDRRRLEMRVGTPLVS